MVNEQLKNEIQNKLHAPIGDTEFPSLLFHEKQILGHVNPCKHGVQYGVLKTECTNKKCPSKFCFFTWFSDDIIKDYHCPYFEHNEYWRNVYTDYFNCRKDTVIKMNEKLKITEKIEEVCFGINNYNEFAHKPATIWIVGAEQETPIEEIEEKFPILKNTAVEKYIMPFNFKNIREKAEELTRSNNHNLFFTPNVFLKWDNTSNEYFEECMITIKNVLANMHVNMVTRMKFSEKIFTNEIINTSWINSCQLSYSYKDKFKGKTVVCVTAGPSLQKQIETLKEIQNKVIIICASTIYKVLLKNGIIPDIVGIIDMTNDIEKYFHDVSESDMKKTKLLFEIDSDYNSVNYYKGDKIFHLASAYANPYTAKIAEVLKLDPGDDINKNGTVSNLLYSFTLMTNPKEIWLLGYDFCYDSEHSHMKGTDNYQNIEFLDGTNDTKFIKFKKDGKVMQVFPVQCNDNKTRWQPQHFKTFFDEINSITYRYKNNIDVYEFSGSTSKKDDIVLSNINDHLEYLEVIDKTKLFNEPIIKVKNKLLKNIIKSPSEGIDKNDMKALFATRFSYMIMLYQTYNIYRYGSIINDLKNDMNRYINNSELFNNIKLSLQLLKERNN